MRLHKRITVLQLAILAGLAAVSEHPELFPPKYRLVAIVGVAALSAITPTPIRRRMP